MYDVQSIASRIKKEAKTQKYKLSDMLKELGLGINAISQLSSGQEMSYLTFASIADYLNCSVDYLLGRTDNPSMTCINGENGIQAVVGGAIENNTVTISPTDEMTKEIALLLSDLTYRQKTELMKEIYDFVDNVKKGND